MLQNTDKGGLRMKKTIILLIALMVISVGFLSGCTEFEEDLGEALEGEVVSVSVYAFADVANSSGVPLESIQVQFDVSKTGGDDFTFSVDISKDGRALCPYVGYNLHEGEIIYVTASIAGIPGGSDSATLTFSTAKKDATDIGNGEWYYQWGPHFLLTV